MHGAWSHLATRSIPLAALAIILAACGGKSSPAAPQPGVPQISNLRGEFRGRCTIQGRAGTVLAIVLDYIDSDGDLRGGTLQTTGTFEPSGGSIDVNFGLPSAGTTITGTTEGTIEAPGCVVFGGQTAFTIATAVVDVAGHSSNILSLRLERPGGAPEVSRGAGEGAMAPLGH